MKLSDKVVLITGGNRGIGKGIAKLFLEEGAKIVITSKNEKKLEETARELGNVFSVRGDIKLKSDVKKVVEDTINEFGHIDILVNNAGIMPEMKPLHKIDEDDWIEVLDVNLNGTFRFTKAVIPFMKKNGGSIINMSSDAGLKAFQGFNADAYSASKAAIILLTKTWALEYAKNNIRVNCICAAVVDTDMTKEFWLTSEEDRKKAALEHPLGRIGNVKDIAKGALYFASDDSSWTTGSILNIDGGIAIK